MQRQAISRDRHNRYHLMESCRHRLLEYLCVGREPSVLPEFLHWLMGLLNQKLQQLLASSAGFFSDDNHANYNHNNVNHDHDHDPDYNHNHDPSNDDKTNDPAVHVINNHNHNHNP